MRHDLGKASRHPVSSAPVPSVLAIIHPPQIRLIPTSSKVWDRWAPWTKAELDELWELAHAVKRGGIPRTRALAERCIQYLENHKI